ncbi:MAG: hypothetical protein ACR2G1_09700 [Rubrobacteraceae bacterium]
MRKNLPYLTQERLNIIFEHVYDNLDNLNVKTGNIFEEEKLNHLLKVLKTMQEFNYEHRSEDRYELFQLTNGIFNFDINAGGTDYWLSLILAIKELYGFSDAKLVSVMQQVSVRK